MSEQTCGLCKYFDDADGLLCRRFPPQMPPWPSGNQSPIIYVPATTFPIVSPADWCGEWREKVKL